MHRCATAVFGTVLGLVVTAGVASGQEKSASDIFESVSGSVVVLLAIDAQGEPVSQGSGVVVEPGVVVSNCHVVRQADSAAVKHGGKSYPAELRHADVERDVCSFSVAGLGARAVPLGSTSELKVGQRVYAIGAPRGLELSLSDGLISSLRPVPGGQYLQITAPISPGSSGGGLFDGQGRLIGLPTLFLEGSQQLNFAVPVEWITALPERHEAVAGQEVADSKLDDLNRGIALASNKDWSALQRHAERWVRREPNSELAWLALADARFNLGEYQEAIDAYAEALRIRPDLPDVWSSIAGAYGRLAQYPKAIDAFQQALRIDPKSGDTWYRLGLLYFGLAQHQEAIDALQQALRIDPEDADAWFYLGEAYSSLFEYQSAIDALRQALRVNPESARTWQSLGFAYMSQDQYQSAIEAARQALRINPDDASAWFVMGVGYIGLGHYEKAIKACREGVRIHQENAGAWACLGRAHLSLAQFDRAIEANQAALRIDPESTLPWVDLGIAYNGLNQHQSAIEAVRQALRINPDDARAWATLGLAHSKLGQQSEMMDAYRNLRRLDPILADKFFDSVIDP